MEIILGIAIVVAVIAGVYMLSRSPLGDKKNSNLTGGSSGGRGSPTDKKQK